MDVFLSGLGGALIGSLIAFLGTWWIQRRAVRHDEFGAARALFFEMVANAAILRAVAWGQVPAGPARQLARTTWEAMQARVGALLKPNELLVVAQAYEDLPRWQVFINGRVGSHALVGQERQMLTQVADGIVEAAEILRDRAWSKSDLDNFPEFRRRAHLDDESAG